MTSKTKTEIKAFFETGDTPTQAQFIDAIDSWVDKSGPLGVLETAVSGGTEGVAICSAGDIELKGASETRTFLGLTVYTTALAQSAVAPAVVESFIIACSDETTALTTGTAKASFRIPYAFTITDVRATVGTAPTGATLLTVDVNEAGTTILSTKLTFDASELTTTTATTPRVISDTSLADDALITIDIDAVGSTIAGAGLKVSITGYRTV